MMVVSLNGETRSVEDGVTVLALVQSLGARADGRGIAVAIGGEVVPRSAWPHTVLVTGVHVEVLTAVQGG